MSERKTLYGHAPGSYECICMNCKSRFVGDKLSVHCFNCAVRVHETVRDGLQSKVESAEAERDKLAKRVARLEEVINKLYAYVKDYAANSSVFMREKYGDDPMRGFDNVVDKVVRARAALEGK